MDDQKKICITEEELLETVNEKVRERTRLVLKTIVKIMWITVLVTVSVLVGYTMVESNIDFVIASVLLSAGGIVGPMLMVISDDTEAK